MGMKYNPLTGEMNVLPGQRDVSLAGAGFNRQIYNLKDSSVRNFRKAVANTVLGISDTRIAMFGDSTTRGVGAGGTSSGSQYRNGFPKRVADMLNGYRGIKVTNNSWYGSGTADPSKVGVTLTYDNWLATSGSGVTVDSSISTFAIGGYMVKLSNTGTFSFTPGSSFDTIEVYYYQSGSSATVDVNVDGGSSLVTLSRSGASAIVRSTISVAAGNHTINVVWGSGTFYLYGIRVYTAAVKEIAIMNWGTGSMAAASGWSQSPANQWEIPIAVANTAAGVAPHLAIVDFGINDCSQGLSITQFESNLRYLIGRLQINGDVILKTPVWGPSSGITGLNSFSAVIRSVALSLDLPYIDMQTRWGSPATANNLGYFNGDFVHPTLVGYADEAQLITEVLQQAM